DGDQSVQVTVARPAGERGRSAESGEPSTRSPSVAVVICQHCGRYNLREELEARKGACKLCGQVLFREAARDRAGDGTGRPGAHPRPAPDPSPAAEPGDGARNEAGPVRQPTADVPLHPLHRLPSTPPEWERLTWACPRCGRAIAINEAREFFGECVRCRNGSGVGFLPLARWDWLLLLVAPVGGAVVSVLPAALL